MGSFNSKAKSATRPVDKGFQKRNPDNGSSNDGNESHDIELTLLRKMIRRDPEGFVLNNLMLCVQFFGNYEKEIEHVKKSLVSSREAELNEHLPPQKHVLLPDILQEHVARNVGFTSSRQTFRLTVEPLHPVRIYTVHDNIDITEQKYMAHYSSVNDTIVYSMLLKPTQHQGYVQLQLLEGTAALTEPKYDQDSYDELCSDTDSVYGPKPNPNILLIKHNHRIIENLKHRHSKSLPDLHDESSQRILAHDIYDTRFNKADSDYDNASSLMEASGNARERRGKPFMSHAATYRYASSSSSGYKSGNNTVDSDSIYNPLSTQSVYNAVAAETGSQTYSSKSYQEEIDACAVANAELPIRCFKRVTYTHEGKIYDPREERKQLLNSKQRRIKLALRRHNYDLFYISSTEFMKYFISLFRSRLAYPLGFDQEAVDNAKREGCVLYCDKIMVSNASTYSRVEQYEIIPAVWLEWPNCAQEWLDRSRNSWPDSNDVGKIKDFGCYVVPEGYVPRRGSNRIEDLEWQLTFPAAERYLETCMTQTQVQIYLMALMLHKTFMRPVFDTMFGLTTAHIRTKLFWMIEERDRSSKWPANRMGECLLTLLNSIYYSISQNEPTLRDYFIRDRNLFQRVPREHLLHTQKQLKRIIENPVMYVFHAMENIRYSEDFFPRLNYEMLFKLLTMDTMAIQNPALEKHFLKPADKISDDYDKKEKYVTDGFWDDIKNQTKKHTPRTTNEALVNPRKATDSIIEISIRCAELDGDRLCILLDFFINHFIKIAQRCHQYRSPQKTFYLDHADRLSVLLSEYECFQDQARNHREKIRNLRNRNVNSSFKNPPPHTPKRNIQAPLFEAPLKERFIEFNKTSLISETNDRSETESNEGDSTQNTTKAIVHTVRFNIANEEQPVTNSKREQPPPATRDPENYDAIYKFSDTTSNECTHV